MKFEINDKVRWTWHKTLASGTYRKTNKEETTYHDAVIKDFLGKKYLIEIEGSGGKTAKVFPEFLEKR